MGSDLSTETWPPPPPAPPASGHAGVAALCGRVDDLRAAARRLDGDVACIQEETRRVAAARAELARAAGRYSPAQEDDGNAGDGSADDGADDADAAAAAATGVAEGEAEAASGEAAGSQRADEGEGDEGGEEDGSEGAAGGAAEEGEEVDDEAVKVTEAEKWLAQQLRSNLIFLVVKTNCPFCAEARNLLVAAGVEEHASLFNVDDVDEERAEVLQRVIETTTQRYGVPVIWVDGFTKDVSELKELHQTGRLEQFLIARQRINIADGPAAVLAPPSPSVSSASSAPPAELFADEPPVPDELRAFGRSAPLCFAVGAAPTASSSSSSASSCADPQTSADAATAADVEEGEAFPSSAAAAEAQAAKPPLPELAVDAVNVFAAVGAHRVRALCALFAELAFEQAALRRVYAARGVTQRTLSERLTAFLCERLGGPEGVAVHPVLRGAPSPLMCPHLLRMVHAGLEMRRSDVAMWLECMTAAMHQAAVPAAVIPLLQQYFRRTAWELSLEQEKARRKAEHRNRGVVGAAAAAAAERAEAADASESGPAVVRAEEGGEGKARRGEAAT